MGAAPVIFTNGSLGFTTVYCYFQVISASGVVSAPIVSVGATGPSYTDIIDTTTLTGIASAGDTAVVATRTILHKVSAGVPIYVNISTPASATTFNFKCVLIGVND